MQYLHAKSQKHVPWHAILFTVLTVIGGVQSTQNLTDKKELLLSLSEDQHFSLKLSSKLHTSIDVGSNSSPLVNTGICCNTNRDSLLLFSLI